MVGGKFYSQKEKEKVIDAALVDIYALSDETGIRYIGKSNCAKRRYAAHMRNCLRRKTPVYNWINKCLARDFRPVLSVLERVPSCQWQEAEKRLIAKYRSDGARLLNVAEGGEQPFCPDETRSNNARIVNAKIADDQRLTRLRYLKQRIAKNIKAGYLREDTAEMLRKMAVSHPSYFGQWLNLNVISNS